LLVRANNYIFVGASNYRGEIDMSIRILALDGSLRAGSYNRQLAEAAIGYSRRDCSEGASLRTAPEIR
jgi:hypothetical protein